jgi:D-alanine--poly(phosphoribitol) ligase subunit 2
MSTDETVLDELVKITGMEEVRQNLDIALFEEHILDSLGIMELIVALGGDFNIDISPAQVDRTMWATPNKIIVDIQARLSHK